MPSTSWGPMPSPVACQLHSSAESYWVYGFRGGRSRECQGSTTVAPQVAGLFRAQALAACVGCADSSAKTCTKHALMSLKCGVAVSCWGRVLRMCATLPD